MALAVPHLAVDADLVISHEHGGMLMTGSDARPGLLDRALGLSHFQVHYRGLLRALVKRGTG